MTQKQRRRAEIKSEIKSLVFGQEIKAEKDIVYLCLLGELLKKEAK